MCNLMTTQDKPSPSIGERFPSRTFKIRSSHNLMNIGCLGALLSTRRWLISCWWKKPIIIYQGRVIMIEVCWAIIICWMRLMWVWVMKGRSLSRVNKISVRLMRALTNLCLELMLLLGLLWFPLLSVSWAHEFCLDFLSLWFFYDFFRLRTQFMMKHKKKTNF